MYELSCPAAWCDLGCPQAYREVVHVTAELVPIVARRLYASGGVVHIQDLVTADPDLLSLVENSTDPKRLSSMPSRPVLGR